MTSYHCKGSRHPSMGNRNPGISRHCNGRGDARHNLKGNIIFLQQQSFLTAPAENKGIPAFETNHSLALLGQIHQKLIDFFLWHSMLAGSLAYIDKLRPLWCIAQYSIISQTVIYHHISISQTATGLQGQQLVVPWASPYQIYLTIHSQTILL